MDRAYFWNRGFPQRIHTVFEGNSRTSKNNNTSFSNFVSNSGLGKFGISMSTVIVCDKQPTIIRLLFTALGDGRRG